MLGTKGSARVPHLSKNIVYSLGFITNQEKFWAGLGIFDEGIFDAVFELAI